MAKEWSYDDIPEDMKVWILNCRNCTQLEGNKWLLCSKHEAGAKES